MVSEKRMVCVDDVVALINGLESLPWEEETEELVNSLEPVDAVKVVHGRWVSKGYKIECSVCEHRAFLGTTDPVVHREEKNIRKYCHNCGAKMDLEV